MSTEIKTLFQTAFEGSEDSDFNLFEPFDVEQRELWLIEKAAQHDVQLALTGGPFQIGLLMDKTETPGYTMTLAGSQCGKSRALLIEAIIMAGGQVPISMRFDKGVDTGVPRKVNEENIKRFGLREDGTCGNVIGVGKYPLEKIPPPNTGAQIWIASYREVKEKMWKNRLEELIPKYLLNRNKGVDGWSEKLQVFHFDSGATIRLITYEQQYKKAEGEMAWMVVLDEEPPDRQYFISALEHCKYLRLCFSPINGLNWSYYDSYLPAIKDPNGRVKIFHCTQFDSPYQDAEKVNAKIKHYKPYEIKARVYGHFSDMAGKPYYNFELTEKFKKDYMPRHRMARILPMAKVDTVNDALHIKIREEPADNEAPDVWEIYEAYNERGAYWLTADVAVGNEDPDLAQNSSAAYVRRLPFEGEKDPMMVASLHSTVRNVEFAWLCLYAACYYNFALMAPETGVSADGAVFVTTISGYPFIYRHISTNDKTRRLQEKFGFDTKNATRKYAFDLVGTWLYDHIDNCKIYHYQLLKELNECITGKGGRPDHPERGSTDCIMAFGISEYVYALAKTQIRNNRGFNVTPEETGQRRLFPNIIGLNAPIQERRPVLGSRRGMDARFGAGRTAIRTKEVIYG